MGFGSLPKLNYNDSFMRAEIFESDSSVFATWMLPPYSVDGWRVDVGNMLGRYNEHQLDAELLPAIRKAVKRVNPQSYLIGENFFEAVGQLQGDAWDGVMNYSGFTEPALHWLSGYSLDALRCKAELVSEKPITTETLVKTWQDNLAAIPWAVALQQFNLLGSHDTSRLGSVLKGDDELIRMAVMIQFTFPGVPCVYYGDEIGLSNEAGFAQRNCFPWDKSTWDVDLFSFYQKLIALRKENQILAQGSFQILYWDEDIIIYQRLLAGERVLVTANRGEIREGFSFRSPWVETDSSINLVGLFCGKQITLTNTEIKIPALAKGGEIWLSSSS
jgi:alpha-glucosidase